MKLMNRMDRVATEGNIVEEKKIVDVLTRCGYPDWTFNKVKEER